MEASFDTEESFDDPSCLAPQPPGSVSPAKRQIREVKETKTTVSRQHRLLLLLLHLLLFTFPSFFSTTTSSSLSSFRTQTSRLLLPSSVDSSQPVFV